MAQLKSTSVIGNLSVTNQILSGSMGPIASTAVAQNTTLSRIPSLNEVALQTGNGDGNQSAWIWRENYPSSNWGIFHDNSADTLHIVGNSTSRLGVNLNSGVVTATKFKGALEGNASSASTLSVTDTTPTSATSYYLWYSTGRSGAQTARANADLYVYDTGTSSYLNIGSSSNSGMITLHHNKGGYINIQTAEIPSGTTRTLTIPNVSGTIITSAGGTLTGPVTSSYSSSTWLNSVNGKSAFNLSGTGYTGWISGPGKDGRLVISSYPDHNNRLYFGYISKTKIDAGTNSLDCSMTWEGNSGTLFANKFAMAVGDTGKAAWQYNSATDCIELAWY